MFHVLGLCLVLINKFFIYRSNKFKFCIELCGFGFFQICTKMFCIKIGGLRAYQKLFNISLIAHVPNTPPNPTKIIIILGGKPMYQSIEKRARGLNSSIVGKTSKDFLICRMKEQRIVK
ncbi:hypothetical protein CIPAW_16G072800 [Carya illinoinensis]|uniref:Uncharacterized protein n=1 Tax=Carya illinoinensis TaxID=32201 RepID=A0A8T1N6L6_CARIL|nr:hypothetical protein CIPAW_16G072800 [Carya illinoinensis]